MLRYDRQIKPGSVALYDIRPGNGAGLFLQPRSPHGALSIKPACPGSPGKMAVKTKRETVKQRVFGGYRWDFLGQLACYSLDE